MEKFDVMRRARASMTEGILFITAILLSLLLLVEWLGGFTSLVAIGMAGGAALSQSELDE
jgi:hypothetical protein